VKNELLGFNLIISYIFHRITQASLGWVITGIFCLSNSTNLLSFQVCIVHLKKKEEEKEEEKYIV